MGKASIKRAYLRLIRLLRRTDERKELDYLLETANPKAPLSEKVRWLEELLNWIRTSSLHHNDFNPSTGQLHNARIRFLLQLLGRRTNWKTSVSLTLRSLVQETSARSLFSEVGLVHQKGFLAEATGRLIGRLIPRPPQQKELKDLFVRIFDNEKDVIWIGALSPTLIEQISTLIRGNEANPVFDGWKRDVEEALMILSMRIGALATLPEVLERSHATSLEGYPFLKLNQEVLAFIASLKLESKENITMENVMEQIRASRTYFEKIYAELEVSGVSVALVYTLENLSDSLTRVEHLSRLLLPPTKATSSVVAVFLASLIKERLAQTTLRNLVWTNLHLISSKIVERAGASGEHYIARTKEEYRNMIRAGLGGGGVMVFTTLIKFWITGLKLPMLFEGLFYSLNYSLGFVALQLSGFTLATKQPSATASALAGKLKHLLEESEVRGFVNEVCLMTRTQFAALVGNLIFLIPFAFLMDFLLYTLSHKHFFSTETANYAMASLHPYKSFTLLMAALTGFYLWLSSIVAGWFENWVVFHRQPEALAANRRLITVFGQNGAKRIGDWVLHSATLFGGNISLGFFMGFTSIIGNFVGLPLDVRHVTLSAASLTFSSCTLWGPAFPWPEFAFAASGVLLIGTINFAVGYSLAFAVAVRAREVDSRVLIKLGRALQVRLRHRTLDFFIPPNSKKKTQ